MKPRHVLMLLLFLLPWLALSQDDSTAVDTTTEQQRSYHGITYRALPDSASVHFRRFDQDKVKELKEELDYKQPPTIAESLWERFLRWISEMIGFLFKKAVTTDWIKVMIYVAALGVLVILIMTILKVDAFKVLYSAQGGKMKYEVLDENIHEMDFEKLIREALDQNDYRRGIRLYFLFALKLLSDKHLVDWKPGKTNHDYVAELEKTELKSGLNELSFYFDYAWYGNFMISADTFHKAQGIFTVWREKLS